MSDRLNRWKLSLFEGALFVTFVVLLVKFVWTELEPVLGPLLRAGW